MTVEFDPDRAFRDFALRDPACLDPSSFALLRDENPMPGWRLEPWPILLSPERAREVGELVTALAEIARGLPERFFGGDLAALADYFELPGGEAVAELVLCEPNGIDRAFYRGDFIETADGFKLIEMNAGSGMTGWNLSPLAELYPRVPAIARFLERHGLALRTPDSLRATLAHLVAGARSVPGLCEDGEVNVAVPASVRDDDIYNPAAEEQMREKYAEVLAAEGGGLSGEIGFCDYGDLSFERGRVLLGGRRIHVVFEQQSVEGAPRRQAIGAFKAGLLDLYTGPATQIIMDKRMLVLLSEHAGSDRFDERERAVVRATVPWTRRVAREEVDFRGERIFLPDLLERARPELVLKKAFSHSGRHVVLGRATGDEEWRHRARAALAGEGGGWVVQEALESVPRAMLDAARGPLDHDVVWGLLSFAGGFHGGYLRTLPKERDAVINQFHGARSLPFLEAGPA